MKYEIILYFSDGKTSTHTVTNEYELQALIKRYEKNENGVLIGMSWHNLEEEKVLRKNAKNKK